MVNDLVLLLVKAVGKTMARDRFVLLKGHDLVMDFCSKYVKPGNFLRDQYRTASHSCSLECISTQL